VTVLSATGVSGGYGRGFAVDRVSLEVSPRRCLAVLGPNGSGKSTLLRLVTGLLPALAGDVLLAGRPLASIPRRAVARRVGYLPQRVDFAFPLSVRELVEQGRSPHLDPWRPLGERDRAAVRRALAEMELTGREETPVQQLSGGERQRLLLARALAGEPELLLLDEPAAGLDVRHQLDLLSLLHRLRDGGVGLAVVLHDWNMAARLADDVLVLVQGRAHASGTPDDVLTPDLFREVFKVDVERVRDSHGAWAFVARS
jgi:iron complex transport system ATP-binding protein